MPKRSLRFLVEDMLECVEKLQPVLEGMTYQSFIEDVTKFHATMSLVSILGEAAAQVVKTGSALPDTIPWHQIRGLRNRLVHEYFDIDSRALWETATIDVPKLEAPLKAFLKQLPPQG
jgi:uncharacterized protein with HEPN domain